MDCASLMRLVLLLSLCSTASSMLVKPPTRCVVMSPASSRTGRLTALQKPRTKDTPSEGKDKTGENIAGAIGWLALFGQLAPVFATALARLGLFDPPPINLLTDIANNAMDSAIARGEIPKLVGTAYGQGIWKDLILEYYRTGQTLDYLTVAGGVCAQHPEWCDGVAIPPL